jgi:hypothetical protein
MQIAVITVKREPCYIHKTINSLFSTHEQRVTLYIGSPDESDYERYRDDAIVTLRSMPEWLWKDIENLPTRQRAAANFWRALNDPSIDDQDLLIVEDDVAFRQGWYGSLRDAIKVIYQYGNGIDRSLITLHIPAVVANMLPSITPRELDKMRPRPLVRWMTERPVPFYGTLGLYVPKALRLPLADYVRDKINRTDQRWPFDECVKRFIEAGKADLFMTTTCWIDHRGDISTIEENQSQGPRRSPFFEGEF